MAITTFERSIGASADDARQNGAGAGVILDALNIDVTSTTTWCGFRFLNVTVPVGAIIHAAYLSTYTRTTQVVADNTLYGEDADNPGTFTTAANNISGRTATTATVDWTELVSNGTYNNSPDIGAIIQEIVDRAGWASGNAMVIIMVGRTGGTPNHRNVSYDDSLPALLHIEYTEGGGGIPIRQYYYSLQD